MIPFFTTYIFFYKIKLNIELDAQNSQEKQ